MAELAAGHRSLGFPSPAGLYFIDRVFSSFGHVRIRVSEETFQPGQRLGSSDLAQQIRNFLRSYYGPWSIKYVFLVGSYAAVPMRYCFPDPDNHWHEPSNPSVWVGSVPTDVYYADLSLPDSESWDRDGDGFHGEYEQDNPDFLPEVYVGRIPTDRPGSTPRAMVRARM